MPSDFPFPIERIALQRTIRLIVSADLRDSVLLGLVSEGFLGDVAEIEGATSGRLTVQQQGTDALDAHELVAVRPHSNFINAAFSYWRPGELNRFNGPDRGAWYSALTVDTCLAEVSFHMIRELERIKDFNATVEYIEAFADFAGEFVDLRNVQPRPECLNPDVAIGYPAGNRLEGLTRARGCNGIIYPSVRDSDGTCLVALWPHAVQSVAQGDMWRLRWADSSTPSIEHITDQQSGTA